MPHLSDSQLEEERQLILAAQRDLSNFAILYERYADQIFAYCYTLTKDKERAEDVTAATFAKAMEELPRFEWRGVPYSAWLYRVAANQVSRLRRQPLTLELHDEHVSGSQDPLEVALAHGRDAEIRSAVAELPRDQREVVVLRFVGGLRNKEISEIMGRSEGAIKLLTFRALTSLRHQLGAPQPSERETQKETSND
jgi:RNA polymerase sigma-70 factor (ECF subfamily)